jgi:transcription initiation factor TFIIH subunit 4
MTGCGVAVKAPAEAADAAALGTQVQVISEFAELLYQLPNLVVAQVTRESVLRAVDCGVSTQQIVGFLERNAHPLMAALTPVLPETVVDQMRLWAAERDRLRPAPARLYENFVSLAVFDEAEQYARDIGVHLFSHRHQQIPKMCSLVVAADAHDRMKSFLKSLSQRQRGS